MPIPSVPHAVSTRVDFLELDVDEVDHPAPMPTIACHSNQELVDLLTGNRINDWQ